MHQGDRSTADIDHLFGPKSGRLVATLTRVFGVHNLAVAEDVVQDAFCRRTGSLETSRRARESVSLAHVRREVSGLGCFPAQANGTHVCSRTGPAAPE